MERPVVSVCIATYNGEKYIKEQLNSILLQLGDNDEIIISDDNSTDATLEIVRSIKDCRIKIFKNEGIKGYTSNFENALKHAGGEYIFLSDQDDVWVTNKVQICIKKMQSFDFVVSDAYVTDATGHILHCSYYETRHPHKSFLGNVFKFAYLGCCMAFKRRILEKALPFPSNHLMCTHDNWLFLVAFKYYSVGIISDRLICYRRHGNNVSTGEGKSLTTFWFKLKYRIYLLYNLCF